MDAERIPGAILLTLVFFVIALVLWYCGVRWNKLAFKQFAVMTGIVPLIAIGFEVAAPWFERGSEQRDFRTTASGSVDRNGMNTAQSAIPVTNVEVEHQIELTPKIRGGDPPTAPLHLRFKLQSPRGEVLVSGEEDLDPGKGLRWTTLTAKFQPHEEGDHTLSLEFPNPAFSVDILVREMRRR